MAKRGLGVHLSVAQGKDSGTLLDRVLQSLCLPQPSHPHHQATKGALSPHHSLVDQNASVKRNHCWLTSRDYSFAETAGGGCSLHSWLRASQRRGALLKKCTAVQVLGKGCEIHRWWLHLLWSVAASLGGACEMLLGHVRQGYEIHKYSKQAIPPVGTQLGFMWRLRGGAKTAWTQEEISELFLAGRTCCLSSFRPFLLFPSPDRSWDNQARLQDWKQKSPWKRGCFS